MHGSFGYIPACVQKLVLYAALYNAVLRRSFGYGCHVCVMTTVIIKHLLSSLF